jgi:hypothetical protein
LHVNGRKRRACAAASPFMAMRAPLGRFRAQAERLQKPLCGGSRPHFFRGVCTVRVVGLRHCPADEAAPGRAVRCRSAPAVQQLDCPEWPSCRPAAVDRSTAQVVTKLFHIVEPDVAVFGRKDYQQWRIICRMVSRAPQQRVPRPVL